MTVMTVSLGFLCVSGPDAKKLLQGQFTCDLDDVTEAQSQLGAHCNPQGRVISLFRLFLLNNHYYLQMPRELIPIAMNALKKYAVFFKVTLIDASDQPILLTHHIKNPDILLGIPAIYPETSGKYLPHELNLPNLNAVSFKKGCYTGQEIIARMHYRGKLKTHLYQATAYSEEIPTRGSDIYRENKPCGNVVDYYSLGSAHYHLLVIASEQDKEAGMLFLDPEQKNILHFL